MWNVECALDLYAYVFHLCVMSFSYYIGLDGWMDELNDWAMICGFEDRMRWHGIELDSI